MILKFQMHRTNSNGDEWLYSELQKIILYGTEEIISKTLHLNDTSQIYIGNSPMVPFLFIDTEGGLVIRHIKLISGKMIPYNNNNICVYPYYAISLAR